MATLKVVEPQAAPTIARLVDEYLASCRARGLSPRTVRANYGYPLKAVFLPWCAREKITEPAQLDRRALDRLSTELLDQGGKRGPLSKFTVNSYLGAVNFFLSWAAKEGEVKPVRAQRPRLPKRVLEILSREEIQRLEAAATHERDKLIVRLLADTGIRLGELLGLRVRDVIERDRHHYLRVRGKGDRERLVPVPRLWRRLQRYAEHGRPRDGVSDRIFLGLRRRPQGDYEPLTESGVEQGLHALGEVAGMGKRVYPHLLRHSYATWALQRGMNPIMLAECLGHSSLAMLQRNYAHTTPADAHEMMAKLLLNDE